MKKRKFKIFLKIILITISIYFLSQKIPSFNQGISLYEKIAIKIYLKCKYPFEKFKIVKSEEYREEMSFDLTDNREELGLIDRQNNRGLLTRKTVSIVPKENKDMVFELDIYYPMNILVFLKTLLVGSIHPKINYSPFYFMLEIEDNYDEDEELNILKKYLAELDKEVYNISKKYFKDDEIVVYFDFNEWTPDYSMYIIRLKDLIQKYNIKNKEDFLIKLQNEKFKEEYFEYPSFEINIIMNNKIDKIEDDEVIKKYYDICKNISNEVINELDLTNYSLSINIGKFNNKNRNNIKFRKYKKLPTNAIRKLDRGYYEINDDYEVIYNYYKKDCIKNGERVYAEDSFEGFKEWYIENLK